MKWADGGLVCGAAGAPVAGVVAPDAGSCAHVRREGDRIVCGEEVVLNAGPLTQLESFESVAAGVEQFEAPSSAPTVKAGRR